MKVTGLWGQKWPVMHDNMSAHDQFCRQREFLGISAWVKSVAFLQLL